jgi:vacuolar protein sorting-associated protein 8
MLGTSGHKRTKGKGTNLNDGEQMWLTLLETVVGITRDITTILDSPSQSEQSDLLNSLRVVVQDIFTRLLTLSSSTTSSLNRRTTASSVSFLSILRQFLQNLASSPLTDLRGVLSSIFDAYRYEAQLIQVTSKLVEADLFQDLLTAKQEREKGWRPTSPNCLACNRILFGPGTKGSIFSKWERRRVVALEKKAAADEARAREREARSVPPTPNGKGKGKSVDFLASPVATPAEESFDIEGDIVVFACGHAFHRSCLAEVGGMISGEGEEGNLEMRYRCIAHEAH